MCPLGHQGLEYFVSSFSFSLHHPSFLYTLLGLWGNGCTEISVNINGNVVFKATTPTVDHHYSFLVVSFSSLCE